MHIEYKKGGCFRWSLELV